MEKKKSREEKRSGMEWNGIINHCDLNRNRVIDTN